jgi:hypothetical protein
MAAGGQLTGQHRSSPANGIDSRDTLLAALGKATLDCLGTVGPSIYETSSGQLRRTFAACASRDRRLLQRIDALLAVQSSSPGRADDLAGHYVSRWNAFVESFPSNRVTECPLWKLESVIDAPTHESVPRSVAERRIGEEFYTYKIVSAECARDGACAVKQASACAAGFGPGFVVSQDARRSRVEVDPAWWLTTYEFSDDTSNPFMMPGYYHPMSYYGPLPGALYGAPQRAGEACSQWVPAAGKHYTDRRLVPIDCGGGWYCMTYCTVPPPVTPPQGR